MFMTILGWVVVLGLLVFLYKTLKLLDEKSKEQEEEKKQRQEMNSKRF